MKTTFEGPTIQHNDTLFTVIPEDSCTPLGVALHEAGLKWHIHVLPPGCPHNPFENEYAMVIEDDTHRRAYIASSKVFPESDRTLVQLLHGDDILKPKAPSAVDGESANHPLVTYVRELERTGTHWHHHMHFPDCRINPHPGAWTISIDGGPTAQSATFESEPLSVLRELELMHFAGLDCKH